MKKAPKVSVVIPCYNEEDYIVDAINSVLTQSFSDFEIIVVDNNSSDSTARIIKEINDARIQLICEKKQGLVFARNHGLAKARGEWVLRMDADARLHQNWLEHALSMLESSQAVAASSIVEPYEKYVPFFGKTIFNFMTFRVNKAMAGTEMLFGSAMILNKRVISKVLTEARLRNDIWEDLDIAFVLKGQKKILLQDTPVYISLRRFYSPVYESIKYLSMWTRTYWYYAKVQSIVLALILIVFSPLIFIFTYAGLAYVPKIKAR